MLEIFALVCSVISVLFAIAEKNYHAFFGWLCATLYAIEKVFL